MTPRRAITQGIRRTGVPSPWMTTVEAAEYLRYESTQGVRDAIARGDLQASRRGSRWFVHRDHADAFMRGAPASSIRRNTPLAKEYFDPLQRVEDEGPWDKGRCPGKERVTPRTASNNTEVAKILGVDTRTLRARMKMTPDHIARPWVNWGTPRRPRYHWSIDELKRWWREVNEWRTLRNEERSSASVGGTAKGRGAVGAVRTGGRRRRSAGKSSRPSQKVEGGTLTRFVKNLPSKNS